MLKSSSRKGSPGGSTRNVPHTRLENEEEFEKVYEFRRELGRGSFGRVYEAQCQTTGLKWAVKSVNKEKVINLHSQKCHTLVASYQFYQLVVICQQVAMFKLVNFIKLHQFC